MTWSNTSEMAFAAVMRRFMSGSRGRAAHQRADVPANTHSLAFDLEASVSMAIIAERPREAVVASV
jgi:hypothetical protein